MYSHGPGALCATDPDLHAYLTQHPFDGEYWERVNWHIVAAHIHKCPKCFTRLHVKCQEFNHPKLNSIPPGCWCSLKENNP